MKFATEYLWFDTKKKREYINVTNTVAAGDIDGSGTFDLGDIGLFSGLFGSPAAASAAAVPEPSTLSFAVILLPGLAIRKRRRV